MGAQRLSEVDLTRNQEAIVYFTTLRLRDLVRAAHGKRQHHCYMGLVSDWRKHFDVIGAITRLLATVDLKVEVVRFERRHWYFWTKVSEFLKVTWDEGVNPRFTVEFEGNR
jgi:hypothetical protein